MADYLLSEASVQTLLEDHRQLRSLVQVLQRQVALLLKGQSLVIGKTGPSGIVASTDPTVQMEFGTVEIYQVNREDGTVTGTGINEKVFNPARSAIAGDTFVAWLKESTTGAAVCILEDCG